MMDAKYAKLEDDEDISSSGSGGWQTRKPTLAKSEPAKGGTSGEDFVEGRTWSGFVTKALRTDDGPLTRGSRVQNMQSDGASGRKASISEAETTSPRSSPKVFDPPPGAQLNIPLCNAAQKGDVKAFFKLLKKKEKIVPGGNHAMRSSPPDGGSSPPTHFRATINDVNLQQQTPLHIVCTAGNYNFAKKLLKHKTINVNAQDKNGWSSLHCACNFGFLEMAKLLIEHGADVTLRTSSSSTAMHYLVRNCGKRSPGEEVYWLEVAKLMLDRGAKPNEGNEHGMTPLHDVASYGTNSVARFLCQHGAKANVKNKFGETPLHYAVRSLNIPVICELLYQGGDPYMHSENGSCLELAAAYHPNTNVSYLLKGLKGLSTDLLLKIMSHLTVRELCIMSQVNKFFEGLCQADVLWESVYETNENLKKVRPKSDYCYKDLIGDYYRCRWREWLIPPLKPNEEAFDFTYKLMLVGDNLCGKTHFLVNFTDEPYQPFPAEDRDIDFKIRPVFMQGKHVKLQIYEQSNHKRGRLTSKAKAPYRQMNGIIIAYSQMDEESFENLAHWLEDVRRYSNDPEIMLVGTHFDPHAIGVIPQERARAFCEAERVTMFETSALTGNNIHLCFRLMAENILKKHTRLAGVTPYINNKLYHT